MLIFAAAMLALALICVRCRVDRPSPKLEAMLIIGIIGCCLTYLRGL